MFLALSNKELVASKMFVDKIRECGDSALSLIYSIFCHSGGYFQCISAHCSYSHCLITVYLTIQLQHLTKSSCWMLDTHYSLHSKLCSHIALYMDSTTCVMDQKEHIGQHLLQTLISIGNKCEIFVFDV
jgi:hypothetical protein